MKIVYYISAFFAYTAVFIESFAFVVLCLIIGFCWDMTTSGAGLAPMLLFVIQTFFENDIDPMTAKQWAIASSSLFAFLLVGALYTASRNGQLAKSFMLAFASFAISFLGITKGMFQCFPLESCWTIHDWQNLLFATTMAIVPIITYSTAAVIINNKFGEVLNDANRKIIERINISITNAVKNMGELSDLNTEADTAKKKAKANRRKAQATKINTPITQPEKGTVQISSDIDKAIKELQNRLN